MRHTTPRDCQRVILASRDAHLYHCYSVRALRREMRDGLGPNSLPFGLCVFTVLVIRGSQAFAIWNVIEVCLCVCALGRLMELCKTVYVCVCRAKRKWRLRSLIYLLMEWIMLHLVSSHHPITQLSPITYSPLTMASDLCATQSPFLYRPESLWCCPKSSSKNSHYLHVMAL